MKAWLKNLMVKYWLRKFGIKILLTCIHFWDKNQLYERPCKTNFTRESKTENTTSQIAKITIGLVKSLQNNNNTVHCNCVLHCSKDHSIKQPEKWSESSCSANVQEKEYFIPFTSGQ